MQFTWLKLVAESVLFWAMVALLLVLYSFTAFIGWMLKYLDGILTVVILITLFEYFTGICPGMLLRSVLGGQ